VRNLRFLVVALLEMTERVLEITDIKKEFLQLVTAQLLGSRHSGRSRIESGRSPDGLQIS
jgi:hypothetical protein